MKITASMIARRTEEEEDEEEDGEEDGVEKDGGREMRNPLVQLRPRWFHSLISSRRRYQRLNLNLAETIGNIFKINRAIFYLASSIKNYIVRLLTEHITPLS